MLHIITYSNELTVDTGTLYNPRNAAHNYLFKRTLLLIQERCTAAVKLRVVGECVCGLGGGGGSKTG